jgi:hypothetical protein
MGLSAPLVQRLGQYFPLEVVESDLMVFLVPEFIVFLSILPSPSCIIRVNYCYPSSEMYN